LSWSAGTFVAVIALAVAAGYFFLTSEDFHSLAESQASTYSGRKTKIAKISIDWGSTVQLHLTGVEVANAEWAKEPHMLKAEQPYPVDLDVAYGATRLTVKGTLQDPFQWKGADVELALSGPNLSDIYPLLGIPGPPTPPYRISGRLDREPGVWKFVNTKWHAG